MGNSLVNNSIVKSLYPYFLILFLCLFSCKSDEIRTFTENDIRIIPKPQLIQLNEGSFKFYKNTKINVDDKFKDAVSPLINRFSELKGWSLKVDSSIEEESNTISFIQDPNMKPDQYSINVSSKSVLVKAMNYGGFLYGTESILQLLPSEIYNNETSPNEQWEIPAVKIEDQPRFKWRGLMLDVSRHFFEKEYLLKTIDRLAMHKMNVLHLHLVDDQGWRVEIKKYPKLTEVGAWRVDHEDKHWNARPKTKASEKGSYGGYLSQDDLKEVVAYAGKKNIEIVPEIELPAHVSSAIAAYPHLSCFNNPIGVPSGGLWPITDIYCAGKEGTFEFLEDVLTEVMDIFPGKYIHIGGDEATKTNWKKCPDCRNRMSSEKLHDVGELQSYFIKRIEKFINANDRKMIGWDEILEGGLAPDATVMSWRGFKGGKEAAKQGHDVVMSPGSHTYFDQYQGPQNEEPLTIGGFVPLSKVYKFDPIVEGMSPEEQNHVLGGQANLWSEYVLSEAHSEYMIFPRLAALSEVLWSPKSQLNWLDFSARLKTQFERYENLGINYAKSAFLVTADTEVDLEKKTVHLSLQSEFPKTDIRYVLGNNILNDDAEKYTEPIQISETTVIHASRFDKDKPVGKVFTDTIKFHKGIAKKAKYNTNYSESYKGTGASTLVNSLRGSKNFHDGQWQAWLRDDMEVIIDLEQMDTISEVTIGTMENQGPDIYFPTHVEVFISENNVAFKKVGSKKREFSQSGQASLMDIKIKFNSISARYIKIKAKNLKKSPKGTDSWLFIDEILIN